VNSDPDIHVGGGTGVAVIGYGITVDEEVLNLMGVAVTSRTL